MSESDLLCDLLQAWRDDIDSVPFPQFAAPRIPPQASRVDIDTRYRLEPAHPHVTNTTHWYEGRL
ncbi:hypothetical protein [Amycolatopsis saalfeldensis]|uniref:Uncharacterized protein n=1 Tax=Amycolatopsis saalfeldensis TaxID=394193 RepID=A0A1H8WZ82_9PSEU|nr:hypothetical protein [Amycolatopsis saalfeldensis]SEP32717.1 hypothetical protein SAMN04489732_10662 [Amycolatopsis saalfeldensis]